MSRASSVSECVSRVADSIEQGESLDISGLCKANGFSWENDVRPYLKSNPEALSKMHGALQALKFKLINDAFKMRSGVAPAKANTLTPIRWIISLIDEDLILCIQKDDRNKAATGATDEFIKRMTDANTK